MATYSRGEVGWVCRRARLPRPPFRSRLWPGEPGFAKAMSQPLAMIWMPLDQFARGADCWFAEDELVTLW
ncbi:hypothetical protein [Blastococcus tunisiensis]|uniref:hypothetical protein n=1 Tax=Blastococcus tunisiensis TaxID=1798228 RepID=UPI0011132F1D|nr:hypothetical protein [Blastococcus sp. DSM 46838]